MTSSTDGTEEDPCTCKQEEDREKPLYVEISHLSIDGSSYGSMHNVGLASTEEEETNYWKGEFKGCDDPNQDSVQDLDWTFLKEGVLFDRDFEAQQLLHAYRRQLLNTAQQEFILVSGANGTGKTALAQTLRDPVVAKGGFFVSGKFDQLQRQEPYAPFVAAFTEFTHLVVSRGKEVAQSIKENVDKAIDSEVPLITDVIPALKQLLLSDKDSSGVKGSEAQKRLRIVFRKFVQAICSFERPLVLVLDDLQWADEGSLDLLNTLATDQESQGLVIIGTCRNNEVALDHPLAAMLRDMEDEKQVSITNIELSSFSQDSVQELMSHVLHLSHEETLPLAEGVYNYTGGNAFFVMQFIENLHQEGFLYMNKLTSQWQWDADRIHAMAMAMDINGVVDLVVRKMMKLPTCVREALKVASCIGADFDEFLLNDLMPPLQVAMALIVALDKRLILIDPVSGGYRFSHNNIQEAAYSLIPERERDSFHLSIGRTLWNELPPEDVDMNIFVVGNQLKHGICLLQEEEECCRMALLFLRASEQATVSSDFVTAAAYLGLGIDLLGKHRHWRDQYDLSLVLYNAAAEAEYCIGNYDRMDHLIGEVMSNARTFQDKIRAYTTKVYSLGARQQLQEAIETGLDVLGRLGETFPSRTRNMSMATELMQTKRLLRGKTDTDLLGLPNMTDTDTISAMHILNIIFTYAFLGRADFLPYLAFRMIKLTLRRGLSAIAALGFSSYGLVLSGMGHIDAGYRYGHLALVILDRFKTNQWLPRVYCLIFGMVNIWKNPLRLSLKPLSRAHQVGLETGDVEHAMVSAYLYCSTSYFSGRPLCTLKSELSECCELMAAYKQEAWLSLTKPVLQHVLNLMGLSENPLVFSGEAFDEKAALSQARECQHRAVLCTIHVWKLILAYYFGDYKLAMELSALATQIRKSEKMSRSAYMIRLHYFYHGLTALALARESRKRKHMCIAFHMLKRMKSYAEHCPGNFLNKVALMEAEIAFIKGKFNAASAKYEESITLAGEEGLLHEQALACERAGLALREFGNKALAEQYLHQARSLYQEWGAYAKAEQMKNVSPLMGMEKAQRNNKA